MAEGRELQTSHEYGGKSAVMAGKKRMSNIEALRILAMLMVTMLHYLDKGGILPELTDSSFSLNGYLAWGLELLSIAAVNTYMLISGFFLVESGFKIKRLLELICQTFFYSLLVPVVLLALGVLQPGELTIYRLLQYLLPVQMNHYWFISAYVMMYLFSPILRAGVKHLGKNALRVVILLLLLFLSVNKSLLPVRLEMDQLGYDGIWFMCVYLAAAYLRYYGLEELERWAGAVSGRRRKPLEGQSDLSRRGFAGYLLAWAAMLGVTLLVRALYLWTGKLEDFLSAVCGYNHILNLVAAVCLFVGFYYWKLPEGWFSRAVVRIAPYTLGVYLLQEQVEVRYLWPAWLGASSLGNPLWFVVRCLLSVTLVLAVGILADMLRGLLFRLLRKPLSGGRLDEFLKKIDRLAAEGR